MREYLEYTPCCVPRLDKCEEVYSIQYTSCSIDDRVDVDVLLRFFRMGGLSDEHELLLSVVTPKRNTQPLYYILYYYIYAYLCIVCIAYLSIIYFVLRTLCLSMVWYCIVF